MCALFNFKMTTMLVDAQRNVGGRNMEKVKNWSSQRYKLGNQILYAKGKSAIEIYKTCSFNVRMSSINRARALVLDKGWAGLHKTRSVNHPKSIACHFPVLIWNGQMLCACSSFKQ